MHSEIIKFNQRFSYEQLLIGLENIGASNTTFSTKAVALYFGISVYKARYCLNLLCTQGLVERSENQRGKKVEWTLL
ncbi:FaeA/PapI family transcriptional regulator [Proteus vulgaris]|uniref:FaeA/PapI family transcriptional regulator n=1 Tax=Proteus vulgaris TaxID=585 RepID=UPI0034E616AB